MRRRPLDPMAWGLEKRVVTTGTPPANQRWRGGQQGQPLLEATQQARPHPFLLLYEREHKHLAAVAVEIERLGIDKRIAAVSEQQAAQLSQVLDWMLAQMPEEARARVLPELPGKIRALRAVPNA